jgi:hypothetical protein
MAQDWNKRIQELNNQLRDFWQNLQYTPEDAKADGVSLQSYSTMCIADFYDGRDRGDYNNPDMEYIAEQLCRYAEDAYNDD